MLDYAICAYMLRGDRNSFLIATKAFDIYKAEELPKAYQEFLEKKSVNPCISPLLLRNLHAHRTIQEKIMAWLFLLFPPYTKARRCSTRLSVATQLSYNRWLPTALSATMRLSSSMMPRPTIPGRRWRKFVPRTYMLRASTCHETSASTMPSQQVFPMFPVIGLSSWIVIYRTGQKRYPISTRRHKKDMTRCSLKSWNEMIVLWRNLPRVFLAIFLLILRILL